MRTRNVVGIVGLVALAVAVAATVAIVGIDRVRGTASFRRAACAVPNLPGRVVDVSVTNMGGPMMGGAGMGGAGVGGVRGGMMRLTADSTSVRHGVVSFAVTNLGSVNHELVILPLPADQIVGTRPIRDDSTVDETASIGEASNTCGSGTGEGIAPGSSSWTTVTLAPGRYELLCNLPGHYAAGMYTQLTVS